MWQQTFIDRKAKDVVICFPFCRRQEHDQGRHAEEEDQAKVGLHGPDRGGFFGSQPFLVNCAKIKKDIFSNDLYLPIIDF